MKDCPHCGGSLASGRSGPDHRRLVSLIRAAYFHWPENHKEFRPHSPENLRHWLLCKAGYRETKFIEFPDGAGHLRKDLLDMVEASIRAAKGTAFVAIYKDGIAVHSPISMSFATMTQHTFGLVRDKIEHVIIAETGMRPEDLLRDVA